MQRLLDLPYQDRPRAEREIAELSRYLGLGAGEQFERLLAGSPAPERALQYFVRLRERQPAAFERLIASPPGLRHLVAVFTQSRFLSEDILENPEWVAELGRVHLVVSAEQLRAELERTLPPGVPHPLELAKFRRRQILRILVRDVLGFGTLPEICTELSDLADVILETAYERIYGDLVARYGTPREETGAGDAHFAVIALGKLGGKELNYSSDIDLMFLYSCTGYTDGPDRITNKEFFKHAANRLTALLSTYTPEGLCYRVDLRLRPDGSLGEACISLEGARQYYEHRARDWELQMLIKARVAAGHRPTGGALLDFVEPRIYSTTLDFSAVEQLSLTRERLNEKLAERQRKRGIHTRIRDRGHAIDVKLERGGIRDIEFVVQCLQRLYGGAEPWVRHGALCWLWPACRTRGFFRAPSMAGWPRPINSSAAWNTGFSSKTTCKPTRFRKIPRLWNCSLGACPAAREIILPSGSPASCMPISSRSAKFMSEWCTLAQTRAPRPRPKLRIMAARGQGTWCGRWINARPRWRRN